MARKGYQAQQKKQEADAHQRQLRRNQIIFALLSLVLIISMVLSLLINI